MAKKKVKGDHFLIFCPNLFRWKWCSWNYYDFSMFSTTRDHTATWQCFCGVGGFSATICKQYVRWDIPLTINCVLLPQYPSGLVLGTACGCDFRGFTFQVDLTSCVTSCHLSSVTCQVTLDFRGVIWQVDSTSWLDKLSLVKWFEEGPEAKVKSQLDDVILIWRLYLPRVEPGISRA